MHKKIVVIATSLRTNGNSETLGDSFIEGAKASGHEVEKITLIHKQIQFCKGCLACAKLQKCVIQDDANAITESMRAADVIVFATPVYYYDRCGQMKTM